MKRDQKIGMAATKNKNTASEDRDVTIWFKPGGLVRVLLIMVAILAVASLVAHALRFGFGYQSALGFIKLFDLNREANVPTWFSSLLLTICAVLLGLIAAAKRAGGDRWFLHWAVLGILFALMSLDEIAGFHERFMDPLRELLGAGGLLFNTWVVLAFVLLPVLLLAYVRFLLALPRRSARLFVLSGAVYIGGVVGVEMFSGAVKSVHGVDHLRFALVSTLEETLEMLGLALFIYALTDYVARQGTGWRLRFDAP